MVYGGGEPDTKLMETAKHTASESKTNHASKCIHSEKLHGIASCPFLSFALSGYNHEWYGTVHAHHASLSFPYAWKISSVDTAYTILTLIKQAVSLYAEYVHIRIHALTHHSWLYSGGASIPDKCLPETSRQQ